MTARTKTTKGNPLLRLLRRNDALAQLAHKAYAAYHGVPESRAFRARMAQIDAGDYLDLSQKPTLNVIIIAIDCLRASELSCNAYHRETTPFLDTLPARFTSVSASPWTYPSVVSILSGLYPHNHKAFITGKVKNFDRPENFQAPRPDILTLPEVFFLSGYRIFFTSGIATAFYPLRGRVVQTRCRPSAAADMLRAAGRWISQSRKPFFAYIHLRDLHQPMDPPAAFRSHFGKVEDLPNVGAWDFGKPEEQARTADLLRYRTNRQLLYDSALRYVDQAIHDFVDSLKRQGFMDNTVMIVTADHGEEFWEHAALESASFYDPRGCHGIGHGHNVFNEIIQVPLLVQAPGSSQDTKHLASATDITPTVLDLLGIRHRMTFDGRNLFDRPIERPLLSEACGYGYEKKALLLGRYKLLYSRDDGVQWLFDLDHDPDEQKPIEDAEATAPLMRTLSGLLREGEARTVRAAIARRRRLSVSASPPKKGG